MLRKILGYILILRPWFWIPALGPAIAGAVAAQGGVLALDKLFAIIFIFGPGIPGAAEALNDFFDRKCDTIKGIRIVFGIPSSGGSGMIQRRWVTAKEALFLSVFLFLSVLVISWLISKTLFCISLVSIFLAITYSAPPIRWKSRGIWSCIVQAVFYGFISFNTGWFLSCGKFNLSPAVAGVLLGMLIIGYGSTADIADHDRDKKNKIKTLPVIYGPKTASRFYAVLMILPYLLALVFHFLGVLQINNLVLIILFMVTCYLAWRTIMDYSKENISKIHMVGVILEGIAPFLFVTNIY